MAKKARDDHTPEQLPLEDDARWMSLNEAVELHERRTRSLTLTVFDLEQKLAIGQLHCMRRKRTSGERKREPCSFWNYHFIGVSSRHVDVYRPPPGVDRTQRHKIDDYGNIVADRLDGWMFYVWRPDFETLWPTTAVVEPRPNNPGKPQRARANAEKALSIAFPGGVPADATDKDLVNKVAPVYEKFGWGEPNRRTLRRALGRSHK
jgi:hypothetical protein